VKAQYGLPLILICSCALVSCGSFTETKQQTDQAVTLLEKDLGVRPEIGFSILNGKLTQVTVIFDSEKLKDMPFSELQLRVHRALAAVLTQRPTQVTVSLRSNGLKITIDGLTKRWSEPLTGATNYFR
jgi:hypothetical protein